LPLRIDYDSRERGTFEREIIWRFFLCVESIVRARRCRRRRREVEGTRDERDPC